MSTTSSIEYFARVEYLSAGGNRNSDAADWSVYSNCLAYGADQNIALWRPLSEENSGLSALVPGHNAKVTALRFGYPHASDAAEAIISGDAEGHVRITSFAAEDEDGDRGLCVADVKAHDGTVNTISCLEGSALFVTGGADALIKIWKRRPDGLDLVHTITTKPRFIPLSLSIGWFNGSKTNDATFIAAAGTRNDIQLYSAEDLLTEKPVVKHCATLAGHEGWIRSLALTLDSDGCYLLASASADKYIRLWKFNDRESVPNSAVSRESESGIHHTTLAPKLQTVACSDSKYTVTFEALLLGHEDWVYSAAWSPGPGQKQLLTASADGSLTVWEADPVSSVWYSASRLGEISGQKGATTATGSSGGFWTGLWSPDGTHVTCLGRTGSWRLWAYDGESQYWTQRHAVSGHIGSVNGVTWATDGSYLLSTSSDQTTRLHSEWRRGTKRTWHEFARPQIHGYDLNCVSSIHPTQFASGADEKLLRVFDEPKAIAGMLQRLCNIEAPEGGESLPETAAIPVLGLSNKAEADESNNGVAGEDETETERTTHGTAVNFEELVAPPTEDMLSRHTLFPEYEKLYGHGYEISTSAASREFKLLATACKASSLDHAVIRLYDTETWQEVKPPLPAHTLTVTSLAWSLSPEEYLLSVGRDRQWSIFTQDQDSKEWKLKQSTPKAHTRMILDCSWSPVGGYPFFVTAGRDKVIKIWQRPRLDEAAEFSLLTEIKRKTAVTAVSFTCDFSEDYSILAAGEEDGTVSLHVFGTDDPSQVIKTVDLPRHWSPSKAVNRLAWRCGWLNYSAEFSPADHRGVRLVNIVDGVQLAVGSADSSLRMFNIDLGALIHAYGEPDSSDG
ncbi:hypothetical protein DV738_g1001, partial [Chaetothyriales sp. CBS 135597]